MMVDAFYDIAATSGLLTLARVHGSELYVDFRAPDDAVLDGLALSRDYQMRYPARRAELSAGDTVEIAGQTYRVRSVQHLGDGSECRASLTRLD